MEQQNNPSQMREGDINTRMRVGNIRPGKYNPRTYFDPEEMAELRSGLRAAGGVITPILIRPVDDYHEVVAGARRRQGSIEEFGEDYEIPVLIRIMSDEEAEKLATIENIHRAAMSPTEEAEAAARELGRCGGDRDEAAGRLGLKRPDFDKRLALMNCAESVKKALTERKIKLGHAELLAAVPKDRQEKAIAILLAQTALPSVAEFKAGLEKISRSMASAIFDKTDCASCHHNSGNQQALFADAVSDGHCTHGECFDRKTEDVLEAKAKSLAENYPKVVIVRQGENHTVIKLTADGATGVGAEQAAACRSCKSFGAAVSAIPGKVGNVYESHCFDTTCHTKKVGERLLAEKKAAAKPATAPTTAKPAGSKPVAGKAGEKSTTTSKSTVTSVQDTQRVVDYRIGVWRKALKKELFQDPHKNLCLLIGVMMTRGGSNVSSTKLASGFEALTSQKPPVSNVGEAAAMVAKADEAVRSKVLSGIVILITDSIEKHHLPEMLKFMEVDLAKHWKLNAEFLDLLTKSEIEVIAEELGLKAALGDQYAKAKGGKKDEFIKALMECKNFDFEGKIPAVLSTM
ncbi:MAG: PRTRC system ParB family protein [Sideroxydans sp.]|jgi:ParB family chromosome partitioning protein